MPKIEEPVQLEPGQSVTVGRAWDGSFYVNYTQTKEGNWFNVKRTQSRGETFEEAWEGEQIPCR